LKSSLLSAISFQKINNVILLTLPEYISQKGKCFFVQDYKRVVSYIHTYEDSGKSKNVGFAKLEARNGLAKLNLQITGQGAKEGRVFSVYLLHIDEYLRGIKLGECRVLQGKINAEMKFGTDNIAQSGMSLYEMHGIYLTTEDAPYEVLASSWTDAEIEPGKFISGESKEDIAPAEVAEEKVIESEVVEPESAEALTEAVPEIEEESEDEEEMAIEEGAGTEQDIVRAAVISPAAGDVEAEEVEDFIKKTPWEELCCKYPKVIAFEGTDRPHRMCLKIDLKDLDLLAGAKREINENIYLIRSYYKYRYLLLIENEADTQGESCLLGIPGTYCKNEAALAKMFGFEDFYPSRMRENSNGSFGYWCKEIIL